MLKKRLFIILILLIVVLGSGLVSYRLIKYQGIAQTIEINDQNATNKILIVTQSSNFKNQVIENLIPKLDTLDTYVYITDIQALENYDDGLWDKLIIFSTIQSSRPFEVVETFINDHLPLDDSIFIINTADSRQWKTQPEGVDAISMASSADNVDTYVDEIYGFISDY